VIQAGGETLQSINSLIPSGIRKNCLSSGRSVLLYQSAKWVIKLTTIIIEAYHCCQIASNIFLTGDFSAFVSY
jgi:hypothetical protein